MDIKTRRMVKVDPITDARWDGSSYSGQRRVTSRKDSDLEKQTEDK